MKGHLARTRSRLGRVVVLVVVVLFPSGQVPLDPPVADAARASDLERVRELIRGGGDVNAAHGDGMTPLHWAAKNGNPDLAAILLHAGAFVEPRTRIGAYTPLHLASDSDHAAVVRLLLEAGADLSARTETGDATPLHLAAGAGNAEGVRVLLEHGADPDVTDSARGQTPLMFAAARGRTAAVRALLDGGADPNIATEVLDVPIMVGADRVAHAVRDSILESFREVHARDGGTSPWRPAPDQVRTAVRLSEEARQHVAQRLRSDAVSTDTDDEYSTSWADLVGTVGGNTALLYAAREGHHDAVRALIEGGADVNRAGAGDRASPLLMSVINGHFDLAIYLLHEGADPNAANSSGDAPLHATLSARWAPRVQYPQQHAWMDQEATHLELLEALLEAGADPNSRLTKHLWYMQFPGGDLGVDLRGATPFWRAAHALDLEAMRLLVAHGADPHVPTRKAPERGNSGGDGEEDADPSGLPPVPEGDDAVFPIHVAAGFGHGQGFVANVHRHVPDGWLPAVRYLVGELGADVNARDHEGYTPLHHAAARGDNDLISYLVGQGADVTAVSRAGETTVDMANGPVERIQPFPATIQLLERLGAKNNHNCRSC